MCSDKPARKMFFIDGFNLYHAIKREIKLDNNLRCCKWLDLEKLCGNFIKPNKEILTKVVYFTALSWEHNARERQRVFISALNKCCKKLDIVYGQFRERDKKCSLCNGIFKTHEEKLTDVNLAITLFENAMKDTFDIAVIVSGDSDLIPIIRAIKNNFPAKQIGVLPPIGNIATGLRVEANFVHRMKKRNLLTSQLPDDISQYPRPKRWI
jgi:uncharacterized LabA/DUF88 family protein